MPFGGLPEGTALLIKTRHRLLVGFFVFFLGHDRSLVRRRLLIRKNDARRGMPVAQDAADSAGDRGVQRFFALARAAFAAQLPGRFDEQENSAHPGMVIGKTPTVGVERKLAVVAQPPAAYPRAAFAALANTQGL